jgi:hypothetical protein
MPQPDAGVVKVCTFGVEPAQASAEVLLIGDSHGTHWRPALQVVARAMHWHAYSMTRNSCPFSAARLSNPRPPLQQNCDAWVHGVTTWLGQHPEVRTIFISARAGRRFTTSAQAGFRAAWQALPLSVTRLYVIRDAPQGSAHQQDCIDAALAKHQVAGTRCTQPRKRSLVPDAEADAARSRPGPVRLLDLTAFFCGSKKCFPVVGGVLVRRDLDHLTRDYSVSLGPYLLRMLRSAP